jgi:transcriptional regulator GlxA family with amidase domain
VDRRPRIALLASPRCTASVLHGAYDLFRSAGRDWSLVIEGRPGEERFLTEIVGRDRELVVANDIVVRTHAPLDDRPCDVVLVPELAIAPGEALGDALEVERGWLRARHREGATIATACSGAVLVAEAGLLDGHEATTHWAYCEMLAARFPRVRVRSDRALVVSGEGQRLVMAGGGTSWLDLALYLVARFTDTETAMQLARLHLIDWHAMGQQPFAHLARTRQTADAEIGRAQEWIAKHTAAEAPVASMARIAGLPERTFARRFRAATGMAPLEYVHTLRIEHAKHLLERSTLPVDDVGREVGYEDPRFFARVFRRSVRLTPVQYRRRFAALYRALSR